MTNVARLLRGLLPVAALSAVISTGLPAVAVALPATASQPVTRADQWWLAELHVPAAWRAAPEAGKGVTIAVLSTGVDASHQDLSGAVTMGPVLGKTGRTPHGEFWGAEGTAVASLIAGHGHGPGGTDGITGVAPRSTILSIQVTLEYDDPLNSDGAVTRGLPAAIAAGIRYAVGHGATVIALPLDPGTLGAAPAGDPAAGGSAAERAAVGYALTHNVLLVAPAGDAGAGADSVNYPAAYPGVIAVGATSRGGQLAPFTSTRPYVTLTAPGSGITPTTPISSGMTADPAAGLLVAAPDGGYATLASTDMSAALTAGVAALIRSRYPWLTGAEVTRSVVRGVITPPGGGTRPAGSGHGALDAGAALTAAAAIAAAHPAPAPTTPVATAPATKAAAGQAVQHAAGVQSDPGHLLRSLVVGIAIAAGALIACLIVAIVLIRLRRSRAAKPGGPTMGKTGHAGGQARHARGQPDAGNSPVSARVAIWPSTPVLPAVRAGDAPTSFLKPAPAYRRARPAGDPPWQPATRPRPAEAPPAMLPAQPVSEPPGPPLAPWEQSPADFATAPTVKGITSWPTSSTGPMYVWNPAATGPIRAVGGDTDSDTDESG